MKYRLVILDFDGTLADSFPFFVSVFNTLAEEYNFRKIEPHLIPGLRHYSARQMMAYVGMSRWKLPFVSRRFISMMRNNHKDISLFDGVKDMLKHLSSAGVRLAIVSSNSHDNIQRILGDENSSLIDYFECGMSIFRKRGRIQKIIRLSGIALQEAIYIGDQVTDLEAARKLKISFGAVSWGYATPEAFAPYFPEEVFNEVVDVKRIA